jgi:hypothetical protein
MAKYRSSQNFATAYASSKQGIAIGIENFVHLKKETVAGTFNPPSIGTQGKSTSAALPSVDISLETDTDFRVSVDGSTLIVVTLVPAGKTSGALIAAHLETQINTALSTAGYDGRVWAEFTGGLYIIHSQKTGPSSSVVISDALLLNIADVLKLGVANLGVEVVGTGGGNFLFMTKAGLKVSQPFEMSAHRTGRQASNIIKKKIVAEGDIEMYVNMDTTGPTPDIDTPVEDILENILGRKTSTSGLIKFDAGDPPTSFLSLLQGNNTFARAFNGGYAKSLKISLPGDGEAKITVPFKCRDGKYASLSQLNGAIVSSTAVITNALEANRFDNGCRVMMVDIDGRTVTHGYAGDLTFTRTGDNGGTLSAAVSVADESYMVPWTPHNFDQVGIDNPVTGLSGTVSLDGGLSDIEEIRSVEISFDPKVEDQDNYYGADGNRGRVVGGRAEITVDIDVMLSVSQAQHITEAKRFVAKSVIVKLGDPTGRHARFVFPNVQFMVPDVELPDEGSVPLKLSGKCLQSVIGGLDAFSMEYV